MPQSQVAAVQNYDFGAPVVEAEVLRFSVKTGGKLALRFENTEGEADGEVTVQVSDDNVTFADTAAENLVAVANEAIQRGTHKDYTILLRAGVDNYFRVQAAGGCRMVMQVRSDMDLGIEKL